MNYTDNPTQDADVHYLNMDAAHARQAESFCERVNQELGSLETFKSFLCDIDPDDPSVQAFHGCLDGDLEIKAFGYDIMMNLYEDYCSMLVEL